VLFPSFPSLFPFFSSSNRVSRLYMNSRRTLFFLTQTSEPSLKKLSSSPVGTFPFQILTCFLWYVGFCSAFSNLAKSVFFLCLRDREISSPPKQSLTSPSSKFFFPPQKCLVALFFLQIWVRPLGSALKTRFLSFSQRGFPFSFFFFPLF